MMSRMIAFLKYSLVSHLALMVAAILLLGAGLQAAFWLHHQAEQHLNNTIGSVDRISTAVRLGTHYAMMLNSREDINQIIQNLGQLPEVRHLRIYSKSEEIKYSDTATEINQKPEVRPAGCAACHAVDPPREAADLSQRTRIIRQADGTRVLELTTPIYNEPNCAAECHVHPAEKKVLGLLDIVVSLEESDRELLRMRMLTGATTGGIFVISSIIIYLVITWLVKRPIDRLVEGTQRISEGKYGTEIRMDRRNEFGRLALAIAEMGREIGRQQAEIHRERDRFERLFELVPCLITVQDRDFRLSTYNRKFDELFAPRLGDFCYSAYKGRSEKCENCPVERTFIDGRSHFSEESGTNKDGSPSHWIVTTAPIFDDNENVVAAMEMSLDVTQLKQLQERLLATEKKYHTIFSNIPNPVLVLEADSLVIIDCNGAACDLYGYDRSELAGKPFLELFDPEERTLWEGEVRSRNVIDQAKNRSKEGRTLFVTIRVSPLEYPDRNVLLVTASDITKRVEAEQQLVQAGKMATLGEMATGVAHELNQPLSVIKTASSYFMRKVNRQEPIAPDVLFTMSKEIDSHVDRATRIINHMREFGRKSTLSPEIVQVNDVIRRAFDIFSQQLKLRGIETVWELADGLPPVKADSVRLEQVFINLLVNARDAIEDRWEHEKSPHGTKRITLQSELGAGTILARVSDTGAGIPAALVDKIFEPFFTTKKAGKGTGLGLSISYGIIQGFGGRIRVAKTGEPGTVIEIELPADSATP